MTTISEESWERAFRAVKKMFEIANLLLEQENSLREFLLGQHIFVNLTTGYGKSLLFQCLPIAADALFERPRGSSVIVVISPLRALMEDQVRQTKWYWNSRDCDVQSQSALEIKRITKKFPPVCGDICIHIQVFPQTGGMPEQDFWSRFADNYIEFSNRSWVTSLAATQAMYESVGWEINMSVVLK